MKTIKILAISFCVIIMLTNNVFAINDILTMGNSWTGTGKNEASIGVSTEILNDASSDLYNLLLAIGTIAAVIVGAILGVQYMMAGVEKKVQVKESLFPYLISCIVLFGSLGIWKLAVMIMKQIN